MKTTRGRVRTKEYIIVKLLNGEEERRTIYVDKEGRKCFWDRGSFTTFEDYTKNREWRWP